MEDSRDRKTLSVEMRHILSTWALIVGMVLIPTCWHAYTRNVWTSQIKWIVPGTTNKEDLIRRFGKPRSDSEEKCWIYVRDFTELIFIFFNEDGTVQSHTI